MRKILTAIGNSTLNRKCKEYEEYKVLEDDLKSDEEVIEVLQREKDVDILFLCQNVIHNYKVSEFIKIIRKLHENIFIVLFKGEETEKGLQEDESLKLYNTTDLEVKTLEKILKKNIIKNIRKCTSKVIAISGPGGIRQKYVFHISCKKCGK